MKVPWAVYVGGVAVPFETTAVSTRSVKAPRSVPNQFFVDRYATGDACVPPVTTSYAVTTLALVSE